MPLFTISLRDNRCGPDNHTLSAAIHAASVASGYPSNDLFQRFLRLEADAFIIDPLYPDLTRPRTDEVLMIEVALSSRTDPARKRALLAALIEHRAGIGVDRENSSFASGALAAPVTIS